jgi:crotonobetainyl-CoA:carnitine CoA-transferase CaiB-like acyl-CoA transferase
MMEGMLLEYGAFGSIKQPTGGAIATAAPSNAYPTADHNWLLIAANSDALYTKLSSVIGYSDFSHSDFAGNRNRVQHAGRLDALISRWTKSLPLADRSRAPAKRRRHPELQSIHRRRYRQQSTIQTSQHGARRP